MTVGGTARKKIVRLDKELRGRGKDERRVEGDKVERRKVEEATEE